VTLLSPGERVLDRVDADGDLDVRVRRGAGRVADRDLLVSGLGGPRLLLGLGRRAPVRLRPGSRVSLGGRRGRGRCGLGRSDGSGRLHVVRRRRRLGGLCRLRFVRRRCGLCRLRGCRIRRFLSLTRFRIVRMWLRIRLPGGLGPGRAGVARIRVAATRSGKRRACDTRQADDNQKTRTCEPPHLRSPLSSRWFWCVFPAYQGIQTRCNAFLARIPG
jgi:hypothetical protein